MLRDEDTPPQHYMLQWIRSDVPRPVTFTDHPDFVTDFQGRVFYSNMAVVRMGAAQWGDAHRRHGPSNSWGEDCDFVLAFHCNSLPPEIMIWFTKMQHGYWPSNETLQAARTCPVFIVPDGHHGSINETIQWRITPNLIERLLMFSLNMVQIKCLAVLKMLNKQEFIKYILCDNCKLTSFHGKTALFFTMNRTHPEVWTKCRLIECIVRCLETIFDFELNAGICGKLAKDMFIQYLCRLRDVCSRLCNNEAADVYTNLNNEINILESLAGYASTTQYHKNCIKFIVKSLMSVRVSVISSSCMQTGQPLPRNIWMLYGESLNTNVASSKLKLASMHYCRGDFKRCVRSQ